MPVDTAGACPAGTFKGVVGAEIPEFDAGATGILGALGVLGVLATGAIKNKRK